VPADGVKIWPRRPRHQPARLQPLTKTKALTHDSYMGSVSLTTRILPAHGPTTPWVHHMGQRRGDHAEESRPRVVNPINCLLTRRALLSSISSSYMASEFLFDPEYSSTCNEIGHACACSSQGSPGAARDPAPLPLPLPRSARYCYSCMPRVRPRARRHTPGAHVRHEQAEHGHGTSQKSIIGHTPVCKISKWHVNQSSPSN
jgi:hypothetical protein